MGGSVKTSYYSRTKDKKIVELLFTSQFCHEDGKIIWISLDIGDNDNTMLFYSIEEYLNYLKSLSKDDDEYIIVWMHQPQNILSWMKNELIDGYPNKENCDFYGEINGNILFQNVDKLCREKIINIHEFMQHKLKEYGHIAKIYMSASKEVRKILSDAIYTNLSENDEGKTIKKTDYFYKNIMGKLIFNDVSQFNKVRWSVRGGINGVADWAIEKKLNDIQVWDIVSMYISQMVIGKFPTSYAGHKDYMTMSEAIKLCEKGNKCIFGWITIKDLNLRDDMSFAPLQVKKKELKDKTTDGKKNYKTIENGLCRSIKEITIPVNNFDLMLIGRSYTGSVILTDVDIYRCGRLTRKYIKCLLNLFQEKCNAADKCDKLNKKTRANSASGTWGQMPINYETWKINDDSERGWRWMTKEEVIQKTIEYMEEYNLNDSKHRKVAHISWYSLLLSMCRYRVLLAWQLDEIGAYCDTDSKICVGNATELMERENEKWRKFLIEKLEELHINPQLAYDAKKKRYLGEWDCKVYKAAKFIKRKVYALENFDGTIELKVAGLPDELAANWLKENGGLDVFKVGLVFPEDVTNRFQKIPIEEGGYLEYADTYEIGVTDIQEGIFN